MTKKRKTQGKAPEPRKGERNEPARPLDNTDHMPSRRKKMIRVFVRRALKEFAGGGRD